MFIRIDKGAAAPISRQIAEQIRAQCLSGALKRGDSLPSVRQLARDLAVNLNTILRVYERLAAEGLLEMRHGEGTFVLLRSAAAKSTSELRGELVQYARELQALIRRGLLLGHSTGDLKALFTEVLAAAREQMADEAANPQNP